MFLSSDAGEAVDASLPGTDERLPKDHLDRLPALVRELLDSKR